MQIEVKEIEPCKLSIHYEAGVEDIFNKRGEVIQHFKKAPVPGFRPGKASIDAIKFHYKDQIEESIKRAMAEDAYHNTLFEKKLRPHGAPRFNSILLADGKFVCDFDLNTKPDIELASYQDLELVKPQEQESITEITEKMLQELRTRFGEVTPYAEGDFVQIGDNVIVDYEGFIDTSKVDILSGQGEMFTIGSSQLVDFDNNLLGMSLGENREFDLIVPATGLPSMAGKTVHFTVTLNMGSKTVPCPLDDELATKLGKKDFAELRVFVYGSAQTKIAQQHKSALNEVICHKLIDINTVDVPNWLSLSEAQYLVYQAKLDWTTMLDADKEKYLELATRNVKLSLILDKIREVEPSAQLTDQEVFDTIKQHVMESKVKNSFDEVIKEMNRTGYLQILMSRLRDEFTLEFISKTVKLVE